MIPISRFTVFSSPVQNYRELLSRGQHGHFRHTLKFYCKVFLCDRKMMSGELSSTCIGLVESLAGPLGFKPATVCTKELSASRPIRRLLKKAAGGGVQILGILQRKE